MNYHYFASYYQLGQHALVNAFTSHLTSDSSLARATIFIGSTLCSFCISNIPTYQFAVFQSPYRLARLAWARIFIPMSRQIAKRY